VAYAGPDYKLHLCTTPNDQLFRYQYALSNPGGQLLIPGSPTGKPQADIKATGAWDYGKGDPNMLIAVLDTGIDYTHPDLADKVIDHGRDFVNDDMMPMTMPGTELMWLELSLQLLIILKA